MEVLEFMLATWWYASISVFVIILFMFKKAAGFVTVKNLLRSILLGLGGYMTLLAFLSVVIYDSLTDDELGDKKLF